MIGKQRTTKKKTENLELYIFAYNLLVESVSQRRAWPWCGQTPPCTDRRRRSAPPWAEQPHDGEQLAALAELPCVGAPADTCGRRRSAEHLHPHALGLRAALQLQQLLGSMVLLAGLLRVPPAIPHGLHARGCSTLHSMTARHASASSPTIHYVVDSRLNRRLIFTVVK